MKRKMKKLSMRNRLMISYAVPLLLIYLLVSSIGYPYLLRRYRSQMDYSMEQSVSQAVSFLESYLQNMSYLAQMVENSGTVQRLLTDEGYGGEESLERQYQEFYELNKEFSQLEFDNSVYRFGLFVPEEKVYSTNSYYFFGEESLRQREDFPAMQETLGQGKDYVAVSEGKVRSDAQDPQPVISLYHRIRAKDGSDRSIGICHISVAMERFSQVMQNANITADGLVYLVDADGKALVSSEGTSAEEMAKWESPAVEAGETAGTWSAVRVAGTVYYAEAREVGDAGWRLVSLIPRAEYAGRYRMIYLLIALSVGVMVAAITLVSYVLSGYYVGRLRKLRVEMQKLQDGNLNVQLPVEYEGDEIEDVYRNFNFMMEEVRRLLQEHYEMGRDVKMAELRALQAQINPHFLYNTLDLVNWIAMDYGATDIERIAWNLARFYRLSLNHGRSLITIGEEIEHTQVYVNIQKYHHNDAIQLEADAPEELLPLACLNIILQPFVENSIVHGIGEHPELTDCRIQIRVQRIGDDILFQVEDNGPGMTEQQKRDAVSVDPRQAQQGYGIKNINFRIKLCFGEQYGVRYGDAPGGGTIAYIRIPALTMTEAEKRGI